VGWLRGLFTMFDGPPQDSAERLTSRGPLKVAREPAALTDRHTVQRWLRDLRPERDQQIFIHRPWGTVAAVADGHHPIGVYLSDGDRSWAAAAPGATDTQELTLEQVEHIMLDALTSPDRPRWPQWRQVP
jgi:hypothetical protein